MSANTYLLRLAKNSPSKLVAGAAKVVHKVADTGDALLGISAAKSWNQASIATRMANAEPTKRSLRFAGKVQDLAIAHAKKSKNTRLAAGLIVGGAAVAKKALQPKQNDVYYDTY
jgi:hypothetical protein